MIRLLFQVFGVLSDFSAIGGNWRIFLALIEKMVQQRALWFSCWWSSLDLLIDLGDHEGPNSPNRKDRRWFPKNRRGFLDLRSLRWRLASTSPTDDPQLLQTPLASSDSKHLTSGRVRGRTKCKARVRIRLYYSPPRIALLRLHNPIITASPSRSSSAEYKGGMRTRVPFAIVSSNPTYLRSSISILPVGHHAWLMCVGGPSQDTGWTLSSRTRYSSSRTLLAGSVGVDVGVDSRRLGARGT